MAGVPGVKRQSQWSGKSEPARQYVVIDISHIGCRTRSNLSTVYEFFISWNSSTSMLLQCPAGLLHIARTSITSIVGLIVGLFFGHPSGNAALSDNSIIGVQVLNRI